MNISKVYIASPYRGRTEQEIAGNVAAAIKYCRHAVNQDVFPICPHIYLTRFLDDLSAAERRLGLDMGLQLLRECSELWVFGERISEGMRGEIAEAQRHGIKIKHIEL
jgi:hypothetical protein